MREFRGDLLNVDGLSKLMGVCRLIIYRYLKPLKDPPPGYKAKGKIFFFKGEVERWLRSRGKPFFVRRY